MRVRQASWTTLGAAGLTSGFRELRPMRDTRGVRRCLWEAYLGYMVW